MKKKVFMFMMTAMLTMAPVCVPLAAESSDVIILEDETEDETESGSGEYSESDAPDTVESDDNDALIAVIEEVTMDEIPSEESTVDSVEESETDLDDETEAYPAKESMASLADEATAASVADTGTCGDNLTWVLDSTGLLTISGTGDMKNYDWGTSSTPWNNSDISSIVIEDGVTSVGSSAFYGCTSLSSAIIPSSVTSVGNYAFYNCSNMDSISLASGITSLGNSVFYGCSNLKGIAIPDTVTSVGSSLFKDCSSLSSITFSKGLTTISNFMCDGCISLTRVVIPDGVTSINIGAFYGCTALAEVVIPSTVSSIGRQAFYNCKAINSLTIPGGGVSIDNNAFYNCYNIKKLTIADGSTSVTSKDSNLSAYTKSTVTELIIPDSVTYIGTAAFSGYTKLGTVSFGNGITEIDSAAFSSCKSLTGIAFPDSLITIADDAFSYCESLTSVTIPDNVTTIGNYAFSYCTSLSSVTLGSKVTTIGTGAFLSCSALTSITIPKSVTSIGENAFGYNFYSSSTEKGTVATNFTIYGYSGTVAETYANSNGLAFVEIGTGASSTDIKTPSAVSISNLKNTAKGITLSWGKSTNATGYYIYRKTSTGSYKKIKTITSASTVTYTDTAVKNKNGTTYLYKVVPYSGSVKGTGTAKTIVRLKGTSLTSVKNSTSKKVKVKWTSVTKVTGYQIQYSTSKTFTSGNKTIKISGAKSTNKTLSSLKKGKTYYIRIRTYKTVNGKTYYSAWSSKKTVKITK